MIGAYGRNEMMWKIEKDENKNKQNPRERDFGEIFFHLTLDTTCASVSLCERNI